MEYIKDQYSMYNSFNEELEASKALVEYWKSPAGWREISKQSK